MISPWIRFPGLVCLPQESQREIQVGPSVVLPLPHRRCLPDLLVMPQLPAVHGLN